MAKGDYGLAEPLYIRMLEIRERALGVEHPSVATALYKNMGEDDRALPLYRRAALRGGFILRPPCC